MKALILMVLLASPAAAQETLLNIHISFDTASATKLQELGEMVIVSAIYSGEPATGNLLPLDEMGMVYLGAEQYTVYPTDQSFTIGHSLGAAPIGNVNEPLVNVNFYSSRFTTEDNLLDCGIIDGPTDALSKSPQDIACKLIGG